MKNKFLCLSGNGPKVKTPQRACDIITACCVLFNISKDDHIQEPYHHVPVPDDGDPAPADAGDVLGIATRNEIVHNFFT